MVQIKSVDYQFEDGKTVQSTRLPGYSGVSGLDAEQDAEDEKREAADLEAVCMRNNNNHKNNHKNNNKNNNS